MTFLDDPTLTVLAQSLNDIEGLRKAQANRLRALTTTEPDKDGAVRGFSLPPDHPAVAAVAKSLTRLDDAEHEAVLALQRQLRTHPLWPWVKAQHGLGAKTVARFLGLIGDPYQWVHLRTGEVHTRSVGQLFAYVGVAGPGVIVIAEIVRLHVRIMVGRLPSESVLRTAFDVEDTAGRKRTVPDLPQDRMNFMHVSPEDIVLAQVREILGCIVMRLVAGERERRRDISFLIPAPGNRRAGADDDSAEIAPDAFCFVRRLGGVASG